MASRFPGPEWVKELADRLNTDPDYERVAANWEGDLLFVIEPDDILNGLVVIYLDLEHGKCKGSGYYSSLPTMKTAYRFRAPYLNFARILTGEWPPMQALLTRKLQVTGSMTYLARNLPTVLEFVRCCRENTSSILGQESPSIDSTDSQD